MNYIVTLDNCGERNIFHIEEFRIFDKFDDNTDDERIRLANEYIEKLKSLDGKVFGSGRTTKEDLEFIRKEFIQKGGWKVIDTSKGVLLSGYFKFIYVRWLG